MGGRDLSRIKDGPRRKGRVSERAPRGRSRKRLTHRTTSEIAENALSARGTEKREERSCSTQKWEDKKNYRERRRSNELSKSEGVDLGREPKEVGRKMACRVRRFRGIWTLKKIWYGETKSPFHHPSGLRALLHPQRLLERGGNRRGERTLREEKRTNQPGRASMQVRLLSRPKAHGAPSNPHLPRTAGWASLQKKEA